MQLTTAGVGLREEVAQRAAREEAARHMHEVLGNRLSLLTIHAGALTLRPDTPPVQVQQAATVIRESAHQALEDLREIIRMLGAPNEPAAGPPQPRPAALRLAREQQTTPRLTLAAPTQPATTTGGPVPDREGRTATRLCSKA